MIVYLIRHGESTGNAQRIHQTGETPLSPLGEIQAGKLAERLKAIHLDEIWSSPMVRARKTADFVNEYQKVEITEIDELKEIKRATALEGKRFDDPAVLKLKQQINMGTEVGPKDPYTKLEDGESLAEFRERMLVVMEKLIKKAASQPEDFTLCVTAHGFVVSSLFLLAALGERAVPEIFHDSLSRLRHANTGITMLKISRKGEVSVLTYSDFSHL